MIAYFWPFFTVFIYLEVLLLKNYPLFQINVSKDALNHF